MTSARARSLGWGSYALVGFVAMYLLWSLAPVVQALQAMRGVGQIVHPSHFFLEGNQGNLLLVHAGLGGHDLPEQLFWIEAR